MRFLAISTFNAAGLALYGRRMMASFRQHWPSAHCLITHGSVAAVEAVILGCPVFVDATSAAAPVGRTDRDLENPVMPDRTAWLHSLANAQFNLPEILSGEGWRFMEA